MAKKNQTRYVCNNCLEKFSSWAGKCPNCNEWNTLEEQTAIMPASKIASGKKLKPESLLQASKIKVSRMSTLIPEVDNVLGGGIVPGSVSLIAGHPGIGKSTLLLQVAANLAKKYKIMYVSGEESARKVALRAERLGVASAKLQLAVTNSTNDIVATINDEHPDLVIIDSIQSISLDEVSSAAGSVSQITNSAHILGIAAKAGNTALLIVGHVTKEGSIAGPKVLEHVVDVVLQLEGDRYGGFKVLRSIKNRFGSTNEAGIFEMTEKGLSPVLNPSAALLAERQDSDGSIVMATMEGSRPLLVEVQALVNPTSYGYPKRTASGYDLNRLNLLVAVLEKRTKLKLENNDIFVNIVGGIRITEPAADLAICMAIASAAKGMKLNTNAVVFGEVGLSGEIRHTPFNDKRIEEAKRLGFVRAIGPKAISGKTPNFITPTRDLRTALNLFLRQS